MQNIINSTSLSQKLMSLKYSVICIAEAMFSNYVQHDVSLPGKIGFSMYVKVRVQISEVWSGVQLLS